VQLAVTLFPYSKSQPSSAHYCICYYNLCYTGDFKSATECVSKGTASSFKFKFFVQYTQWAGGALAAEVRQGRWHPVTAGKMSIMRFRDKQGPDTAKPMWTDMMQVIITNTVVCTETDVIMALFTLQ
jgi:putative AlgH/UPF0301 family transcriptional regulator